MEAQWSLVLFTVISGVGAWLFASSMIQALARRGAMPSKVEAVVAIVLLIIGGIASATHLKHVERIFEALNHPTSGIFVEAALIGILVVLMAIYLVMLVRKTGDASLKTIGIVTTIVAVIFPFMCGYSYMMEARQAWMTIALPLAYWATPAAAGAGLSAVLKAKAGAEAKEISVAGVLTAVLGVLGIVCSAAFFAYASGWMDAALAGTVTWIVATFVTGVLTAAAGLAIWKKPEQALAGGVAALVLGAVCATAMRVGMWMIGTPVLDFFLQPLD